jgi:hypothetical protein
MVSAEGIEPSTLIKRREDLVWSEFVADGAKSYVDESNAIYCDS